MSDDDLGARQIEREECLEVLLDRDPPHADEKRPRQVEIDGALGLEKVRVDAASPQPEIVKSPVAQFRHERAGGNHRDRCGCMEPPQRRVGPPLGDREARPDIFGKSRRVARRERQSAFDAVAPHQVPDRAFRGDVDGIRRGALDAPRNLARVRQRHAQALIGRHRHRGEAIGRQELDGHALPAQASGKRHQRADDAVDLRMPGIGRDEKAHQTPRTWCCVKFACSRDNVDLRQTAPPDGGAPAVTVGQRPRSRLHVANIRSRYFTRVTVGALLVSLVSCVIGTSTYSTHREPARRSSCARQWHRRLHAWRDNHQEKNPHPDSRLSPRSA